MIRFAAAAIARSRKRKLLIRAVECLPPELRTVYQLTAIGGIPYSQAAIILGIRVGQVEERLADALVRLRLVLDLDATPSGWRRPVAAARRKSDAHRT